MRVSIGAAARGEGGGGGWHVVSLAQVAQGAGRLLVWQTSAALPSNRRPRHPLFICSPLTRAEAAGAPGRARLQSAACGPPSRRRCTPAPTQRRRRGGNQRCTLRRWEPARLQPAATLKGWLRRPPARSCRWVGWAGRGGGTGAAVRHESRSCQAFWVQEHASTMGAAEDKLHSMLAAGAQRRQVCNSRVLQHALLTPQRRWAAGRWGPAPQWLPPSAGTAAKCMGRRRGRAANAWQHAQAGRRVRSAAQRSEAQRRSGAAGSAPALALTQVLRAGRAHLWIDLLRGTQEAGVHAGIDDAVAATAAGRRIQQQWVQVHVQHGCSVCRSGATLQPVSRRKCEAGRRERQQLQPPPPPPPPPQQQQQPQQQPQQQQPQ